MVNTNDIEIPYTKQKRKNGNKIQLEIKKDDQWKPLGFSTSVILFLSLHDNLRSFDIVLDGLVRQDLTTVDIDLVLDGDVFTQDGDAFQSGPSTDGGVPTDDGGLDESVVLDLGVLEDGGSDDSDTVANDDVRADDNVRTDGAALADLG